MKETKREICESHEPIAYFSGQNKSAMTALHGGNAQSESRRIARRSDDPAFSF